MKITRKISEILDTLAEWLGLMQKPIPVPIPKNRGKTK
jgi:hypothetical protein